MVKVRNLGGKKMTQRVPIDRAKRLFEEPHLGHNRYHPEIEPILEVDAVMPKMGLLK